MISTIPTQPASQGAGQGGGDPSGPDPAEVRAALDENRAIRATRKDITPSQRALGEALDDVLESYLEDPESVDPVELRNVEFSIDAHGRRRLETDGVDWWAGVRQQRLDLLLAIRSRNGVPCGGNGGPREKSRYFRPDNHDPGDEWPSPSDPNRAWVSPMPAKAPATSVGERIAAMRANAGLSRRQLSKDAGVSERQLYDWEHDKHEPTPRNLRRLIPHIGGTVMFYLEDEA